MSAFLPCTSVGANAPSNFLERERKKIISPLTQGEHRIGSSGFLNQCLFQFYLLVANYGTIFAAKWSSNGGLEAVVSKLLVQGHKGLTAHRCSFCFAFLPTPITTPCYAPHALKITARR